MTVSVGDDIVELPSSLIRVLLAAIDVLEHGDTVVLVSEEAEVSPAEAAKLLGVSRQYADPWSPPLLPSRRPPRDSYRRILGAGGVGPPHETGT